MSDEKQSRVGGDTEGHAACVYESELERQIWTAVFVVTYRSMSFGMAQPVTTQTTYEEWIEAQGLPSCPAGLCAEASQRMADAFPELKRTRGHFVTDDGKLYPHCRRAGDPCTGVRAEPVT